MSIESRVIDLLHWIKERGIQPERANPKDLYFCPFTRRVRQYRRMQPHQRRTALWIPNAKGLERLGVQLKVETLDHSLTRVSTPYLEGAGAGEEEACLSFLSQVRYYSAH